LLLFTYLSLCYYIYSANDLTAVSNFSNTLQPGAWRGNYA